VAEVLRLGASDAEIAEILDVALYMGGSMSLKMVRYAFQLIEELRPRHARTARRRRPPAS
jgi:alkylhydroperoxidase/carboxymuconolactone decarboxylase family protein YurZ